MSTFANLLREQIRVHYTFVDPEDPGTWVLQTLVSQVLQIEKWAKLTEPEALLDKVLRQFQLYSRTTSDYYGNGPWPMFIAVAEVDKEGALRFMRNVIAFEMEGKKPSKSWTE